MAILVLGKCSANFGRQILGKALDGVDQGVLGIRYIAVFLIGYTVYLRYFQVFGIPKFCEFLV